MAWTGDLESFAEECARARDVDAFVVELRSVPAERWSEARARVHAWLDQVVPGEPESPPLTYGESRGAATLTQEQLKQQSADLEAKRRALADENRRRA
jgi:hypothetical protein